MTALSFATTRQPMTRRSCRCGCMRPVAVWSTGSARSNDFRLLTGSTGVRTRVTKLDHDMRAPFGPRAHQENGRWIRERGRRKQAIGVS